jgi:YqaJ-like viral recombinase domain
MSEDFEWLGQRRGIFTASEFHRLCTYRDGLLIKGTKAKKGKNGEPDIEEVPDTYDTYFFPDGAKTYATEKAVEMLTMQDMTPTFKSKSMEWGSNTEAEAIEMIYQKYGLVVEKYGDNQEFVKCNKDVGCTPDGLIDDDAGIETKCPEPTTHIKYLQIQSIEEFKELKPEYYWQIQGCMYVTGREKWLFVSYDPRFLDERLRLKTMILYRDEKDIAFLDKRLKQAIAYRNEVYNRLTNVNLGIVHNQHKQAENA